MRFVGRGHPAIRATHHKTLELTAGADLTARGTCIIAVAAEPEPVAPMAGPVRIRITAGGVRFALDALANPTWDPSGPVVVRRSPLRLPGTFATDASAVAADLPRDLVAALQDPDALVIVDVAPRPTEGATVVLFAADLARAADAALRAELDRADVVVAEDADARRLVGAKNGADVDPDARRTLVVATRDLPGRTVRDLLAGAAAVDTVGLPARLAAAAACPLPGPLTLGTDADLLRTTPAAHRLVLPVAHDALPALLERAARERGSGAATVVQEFDRPRPASPERLPSFASSAEVLCCLHPASGDDAIDPAARAAVSALLADGVPTRTAARALAALTGWDRRRAYAAIVDWPAAQ